MLDTELPLIDLPRTNVVRSVGLAREHARSAAVLVGLVSKRRTHHVGQGGVCRCFRRVEIDQRVRTRTTVGVGGAALARCTRAGAIDAADQVRVLAEVVGVHTETAANDGVGTPRPSKTNAGEEDVVNRLLYRVAV